MTRAHVRVSCLTEADITKDSANLYPSWSCSSFLYLAHTLPPVSRHDPHVLPPPTTPTIHPSLILHRLFTSASWCAPLSQREASHNKSACLDMYIRHFVVHIAIFIISISVCKKKKRISIWSWLFVRTDRLAVTSGQNKAYSSTIMLLLWDKYRIPACQDNVLHDSSNMDVVLASSHGSWPAEDHPSLWCPWQKKNKSHIIGVQMQFSQQLQEMNASH